MRKIRSLLILLVVTIVLECLSGCSAQQVDVVSVGVKGAWYYTSIPLKEGRQYIIRVEGVFQF